MRIGDRDTGARVLVVAEIGNNHEGDVGAARELVRLAAEAGADAVKLQTYRTALFVRPADADRYARLERFELPPASVAELQRLARELGLLFLSTPLDLEAVALLEPLVDAYKIASGDNDFWPLLDAVRATRKPVVVSTGMSTLEGVARAVDRLRGSEVALLQCTSAYPAPEHEANLAAIGLLAARFRVTVGYSDHTLGIDACVAAVAAGARIVEKHFTLDKARGGFRDHQLSADPDDLRELVRRVRDVETLLGRPEKTVQPSEEETVRAARRSVVAARDLEAGHAVAWEDLVWLRPRDGLAPDEAGDILGATLVRAVAAGEPIRRQDVS